MSSCLGLYIETNVIKYAKVTKERENLRIESFGIKFYEKVGEAIKQVVSETYSYNIPISVNLSEEMYNYFYMFSLLNKSDLKKAIDTEFESYCYDKKLNKNAYETRYALSNEIGDRDKIKVIHVSTNKTTINKIMQTMGEYKVSTITPIGTSIANIGSIKPKENIIIINMEEETTVSTIVNQKIYNISKMQEGAGDVLSKIVAKENSYSKAYEICRNSTIYTVEGKELQDEENEYLDYIMPTLYKIVTKVQEYVNNSTIKFDKIYLTGTLSVINNIDLYFQEFFQTEKCEVLKPYFVTENIKINVKDYIEVNSAIAIAMQGLGYGIRSMNFKKPTLLDQLPEWLKLDVGFGKKDGKSGKKFNMSMSGKFDMTERWLTRISAGVLMLTILYSGFSIFLDNRINAKISEAQELNDYTDSQINLADTDIEMIKAKANSYDQLRKNLETISQKIEEDLNAKGAIPNLLMSLASAIPNDVQITEIENIVEAQGNKNVQKITIRAQSKYYDELGYFKAKIKEDNILKTVTSTQGQKEGEFVKIVIEGVLP